MNVFDFIPGFRSGELWKGIIASLYYVSTIYYFIHTWGALMFLLVSPFAFFSFIDIFRANTYGLDSGNSKYIFIVSCILLVISAIGVFRSFFSTRLIKKGSLAKEMDTKGESLNDTLKVHFLGIGQGDSILIQQSNRNVLIDGGYWLNGKVIVKYLKEIGVERIDYCIATHPHPDHIGGLPRILKSISVENIIMPKDNQFSTKKYREKHKKFTNIIEEKNINIVHPKPGEIFKIGKCYLKILAPNGNDYKRLNNYSIVSKLIFENTSFLFMGDAESYSEAQIMRKGFDIKADVLKVGHHGSCTSSSENFIKTVSPKYAVICVGKNSFYGQPDKCVLDRLKDVGTLLFRTDKQGTIIAISDGDNVKFNTESCLYPKTKIPYISIREKYKTLHKMNYLS